MSDELKLFACDCEGGAALRFANIREKAGWSKPGARAGPKIAALLAEAMLDIPGPSTVAMRGDGVVLVLESLNGSAPEPVEKLGGHAMFQDEAALNRLRMRADCRFIDLSESAEDPFRAAPVRCRAPPTITSPDASTMTTTRAEAGDL